MSNRYNIILADPPWFYNSRCHHSKTRFGGGVHAHYPTMPTEDICKLPVRHLADTNCALFLWTTGPHLGSGIEVIEAWGFRYVSIAFTWIKTTKSGAPWTGPGYYTKSNTEVVLLGMKGRIKPERQDVPQVLLAPHPRNEQGRIIHSRKPAEARDRIIHLFGDLPRVEIFAREAPEGWDTIGNQLDDAVTLRPERTLFDWRKDEEMPDGKLVRMR